MTGSNHPSEMKLTPGQLIGGWTVVRDIGPLGLARVYAVTGAHGLGTMIEYRVREPKKFVGQAHRFVGNDGVMPILDALTFGGVAYVVIDLGKAAPLASLLVSDKAWPAEQVAAFAARLEDSLARLRQANLSHGSVSPEWIVVDPGETWKVRLIAPAYPEAHAVSGLALLAPSPYAPPEAFIQPEGGFSGDLYGAAAVLFRLSTGRPLTIARARMQGEAWAPVIERSLDLLPASLQRSLRNHLSLVAADRVVPRAKTRKTSIPPSPSPYEPREIVEPDAGAPASTSQAPKRTSLEELVRARKNAGSPATVRRSRRVADWRPFALGAAVVCVLSLGLHFGPSVIDYFDKLKVDAAVRRLAPKLTTVEGKPKPAPRAPKPETEVLVARAEGPRPPPPVQTRGRKPTALAAACTPARRIAMPALNISYASGGRALDAAKSRGEASCRPFGGSPQLSVQTADCPPPGATCYATVNLSCAIKAGPPGCANR